MFNPDTPKDDSLEKMPNSKPSSIFLPDAMAKHSILPNKFMEWVLPSTVELEEDV